MFGFNCGCFSSKPEVSITSNLRQNNFLPTFVSSTDQGGGGEGVDSASMNKNSSIPINNSQHTSSSQHSIHNEMSNYSLIFDISAQNTTIKKIYDFLYIVPEKAPLCASYSQVNPRYKVIMDINSVNDSVATAKYNIQYLSPNEIYKIYYVRRDKNDKLEELHTTARFKFILRTKALTGSNSSKKRLSTCGGRSTTQNTNEANTLNTTVCQPQYGIEIVQAYEGDPDFYRENFDFELKLLVQTPQSKSKGISHGLEAQPVTAPFQITNHNKHSEILPQQVSSTANKNNKNFSALQLHNDSRHSSIYQTNITDSVVKSYQQKFNQNRSNFGSINTPIHNNSQVISSTNNQTLANSFNIHHNHKNSKVDETFIVDDSKFNDYALKMNSLLKQKIESENHAQQYNPYIQLQKTNKQNSQKFNGRTLSQNAQEVTTQGLKQPQSAPKNTSVKSTNNNNNLLNKNKAFIYNSECSQNSFNNITPQSRSNIGSDYQLAQQDNSLSQSCQMNQKILYRTFKDSKSDFSQSLSNQPNNNINNKFIMQTPNKKSINTPNIKSSTTTCSMSVQHSGKVPNGKLDFPQENTPNQGSITHLGRLLKTQQKHSFQSSNKSSIINTPKHSAQKFNLRFENEVQKMIVEQKIKNFQQTIKDSTTFNYPLKKELKTNQQQASSNLSQINPELNEKKISKEDQEEGENTPVEQKLFTVEEANSPFETSINRFYTQKSSPSKYRVTQTEYNRIDETDEYNMTQNTNSDLKKIKHYLKQFRPEECSFQSSSHLKTYEQYQTSSFNQDYSKLSQNKNSLTPNTQMSRREKTIQYMIPVYEYKMEKLGFNFAYDAENKYIIISKQKCADNDGFNSDKHLQQSVFKIDERIKTDQLTNYLEDICANIKYQTID